MTGPPSSHEQRTLDFLGRLPVINETANRYCSVTACDQSRSRSEYPGYLVKHANSEEEFSSASYPSHLLCHRSDSFVLSTTQI